jgi:hypothetical protein
MGRRRVQQVYLDSSSGQWSPPKPSSKFQGCAPHLPWWNIPGPNSCVNYMYALCEGAADCESEAAGILTPNNVPRLTLHNQTVLASVLRNLGRCGASPADSACLRPGRWPTDVADTGRLLASGDGKMEKPSVECQNTINVQIETMRVEHRLGCSSDQPAVAPVDKYSK